LGTESGLNYSGRQWTRDTPETSVALKLYGIVKGHREAWLRRKEQQKLIREALENVNKSLGRPPNFRPKPKSLKVSDKLAQEFERRGRSAKLARNLRPLDRTNYKQWYEAAMPEFVNFYGADFEDRKLFAGYWKNAAYKDKSKARALIRRDIKKKIQQAFRSIAPKSSAV
jgi:hypothetical protein